MHAIMIRKDVTETAHRDYLACAASLFLGNIVDDAYGAAEASDGGRRRNKCIWGNTIFLLLLT